MDSLKEEIIKTLRKEYCRCEDAISGNDLTKDEFIKIECVMSEIARVAGLEKLYYPFK